MVSELVAELPELGLPLVLEAELEGLLRDAVVQSLHARVSPTKLIIITTGITLAPLYPSFYQ